MEVWLAYYDLNGEKRGYDPELVGVFSSEAKALEAAAKVDADSAWADSYDVDVLPDWIDEP